MYLSQLQLNPRHRHARKCLSDAQELHRTIMRAFPQAPDTQTGAREHFGVLHRQEVSPRHDTILVLVQSLTEPEWSQIDQSLFSAYPQCKCVNESVRSIRDGQMLAFRLRANPTKRVRREFNDPEGRWTGKRVALTVERDADTGTVIKAADHLRTEWLKRKGDVGGFQLVELADYPDVTDVRVSPEARVFASGRQRVFWPVLYEGHLRVTDVERFKETLASGIGPAKAYGFGLLSVAPPR